MAAMAAKGNRASVQARSLIAKKRREYLLSVIDSIRRTGYVSYRQIAAALNERGITAARPGS
jgi:hypothetical protein